MKPVPGSMARASLAGVAVSAGWHAVALAGSDLPAPLPALLIAGIFVLGVPAVIRQVWLQWSVRDLIGFRMWRMISGTTPGWLQLLVVTTFAYAWAVILLPIGGPVRSDTFGEPGFAPLGSAAAMGFYSAFALLWAARPHQWEPRTCTNGHLVAPDEIRCPRCGALPRAVAPAGA